MILHRWLRSQMLRHRKSEESAEAQSWGPLLQSLSQVLQENETEIHRLKHGLEGLRHENEQLYSELEAERFKLQTVLDSIGSGILIVDPDGRVVFVSPLAESMLGWMEGELAGKSLRELFDASLGRLKHATGEWLSFDYRLQPMQWGDRMLGQVLAFRPDLERLEKPRPTLFGWRLALLGPHRASGLLQWMRDRGAAALAFTRPEDFLAAAERASEQNLGFHGLLADSELSSDVALLDQISRLEELPTLVWLVDDEESASAGQLRLPVQETALLALLERRRNEETSTFPAVTASDLDRELAALIDEEEGAALAARAVEAPPEPEPVTEAHPEAQAVAEAEPEAEAEAEPEAQAEAEAEAKPEAQAEPVPEAAAPAEKLRVLIVEDEIISRTILEQCVRSMGHECLAAGSGDQAWSIYQKNDVDVIISDWMMPGLTGPELCQAIRQSPGRQPKFILLTALSEESQLQDSSSVGVDYCLRKPVNPDEIASLLRPLRTTA